MLKITVNNPLVNILYMCEMVQYTNIDIHRRTKSKTPSLVYIVHPVHIRTIFLNGGKHFCIACYFSPSFYGSYSFSRFSVGRCIFLCVLVSVYGKSIYRASFFCLCVSHHHTHTTIFCLGKIFYKPIIFSSVQLHKNIYIFVYWGVFSGMLWINVYVCLYVCVCGMAYKRRAPKRYRKSIKQRRENQLAACVSGLLVEKHHASFWLTLFRQLSIEMAFQIIINYKFLYLVVVVVRLVDLYINVIQHSTIVHTT